LRQALVVPIQGLLLKIAAVPVDTPFLLSNTLLRAIGATVDTANHVLHATKLDRSFPLILTGKGLFLLDLNDLAKPMPESTMSARPAETHTTVSEQTECASSRAQQSQACQHVQKPKKHHVSVQWVLLMVMGQLGKATMMLIVKIKILMRRPGQ